MGLTLDSLGLRSDLVAAGGATVLEDRGDHAILRTPEEPDYWSGNAVVVKAGGPAPAEALTIFEAAFPEATHRTLFWDLPSPEPEALRAELGEGFEVTQTDVLAHTVAVPPAPLPQGLAIRQIEGGDWDRTLALQLAIAGEEGYDIGPHEAFLRTRNAGRRRLIEAGRAAWFGAFDGEDLAGQLGIVTGDGIARFQAVETAKSHRRRGIASALIDHARRWALARDPKAEVVIVADSGGAPARLYHARGFRLRERLVEAMRAGY